MKKPRNSAGFVQPILLVLVVVAIGGAYYFGKISNKSNIAVETPTEEPIATETQKPTPDPTANWKTYTDKNGAFSFKYPNNWFLGSSLDGDSLLLDESSFDPNLIAEPDQVDITFTTTADKELIDSYKANFVPTSQITINNVIFSIKDKSLGPKEDGPASQYLFAQTIVNSNLYRFGLTSKNYKPVFDQILSTFKFTK